MIINRYPYLGEEIVTSTWPYGFRGFMGFRNFTMDTAEGERLAYANTFWTFIDGKTDCPASLALNIQRDMVWKKRLDMEYASRKIILPETLRERKLSCTETSSGYQSPCKQLPVYSDGN